MQAVIELDCPKKLCPYYTNGNWARHFNILEFIFMTPLLVMSVVPCQVEQQFKILWADHGDDIARQYAGTGALKSGFTRTGCRRRCTLHHKSHGLVPQL
jgi:hypothetical protein